MQDHDMRLPGCRSETARFRRMRCEKCQCDQLFAGPKCLTCGEMPAPIVRAPRLGRTKYLRLQGNARRDKRLIQAKKRAQFREMCGIKEPSK